MAVFELIEANGLNLHGDIEHFAALVEAAARADEREECAKVVDAIEARCVAKDVDDPPLAHVAAAIRARGTT